MYSKLNTLEKLFSGEILRPALSVGCNRYFGPSASPPPPLPDSPHPPHPHHPYSPHLSTHGNTSRPPYRVIPHYLHYVSCITMERKRVTSHGGRRNLSLRVCPYPNKGSYDTTLGLPHFVMHAVLQCRICTSQPLISEECIDVVINLLHTH